MPSQPVRLYQGNFLKGSRSTDRSCPMIKFAGDSEITGKIKNHDGSVYIEEINSFVKSCDDNYLYLNVSKTKEMRIDFRKRRGDPKPVWIIGEISK